MMVPVSYTHLITSIVVGVLWLNEGLTLLKVIGCILVLLSTFILVKSQNQEGES